MDEEYTTMDGDDFVAWHKSFVFFPKGQNFERASRAVRGIVKLNKMSRTAR